MNSFEAKKILIENFLSKRGYEPSSRKSSDLWYKSPFRENDKTPSFKVNLALNTWYDFSIAQGGTIIDLCTLMYNETVSETLHRLGNDFHSSAIPKTTFQTEISDYKPKDPFELKEVADLSNPKLIQYLESRSINPGLASKYVKQIHFLIKKTNSLNFALAIANSIQGYEFRNVFMKGSINGKSYTLINSGNNKDIAIFEGFIDFLSFITDHNLNDFQSTVLILNSVNLRNETLKVFEEHQYKKAYCFLDNDSAGRESLDFYKQNIPIPISDKSSIYTGFNDYNEYLQSKSS